MKTRSLVALACAGALLSVPLSAGARAQNAQAVSEQEAFEIGVEAYHYFYPLISMDVTRRVMTNHAAGVTPGMGPMNAFHHMRAFPDADFREVVRPNFDTLYSVTWLDLTREPMIVSAPDTAGRYYLLPMVDMWSDVFAAPGKRTSGTQTKSVALTSQGWQGNLPAGVERIVSPTPYVWIIGRTQTNGPTDYPAVHKVQDGYRITPLSQVGARTDRNGAAARFVADPKVDMKTPPLAQVNDMPAAKYFSYGAELMKTNPPHATDWSQVSRLKRIGIKPGSSFDFNKAPPGVRAGLERAAAAGLQILKDKQATLARVVNGWQMNVDTMGVYGNFYLKRAVVAMAGLGANQPEDAIYPLAVADSEGRPLEGAARYALSFKKDELPPADAFWSITMYDAQGFQVANPLNRFAIGDRDALAYNPDGSLDLYIQHESPGAEKETNWLPAPASGALGVTMRIYAPKLPALDGRWAPPAVTRVSGMAGR